MIVGLLAFLLILSASSTTTQAAEKIRISVSGSYNMIFLSAGVAQNKGLFNVRVETLVFEESPVLRNTRGEKNHVVAPRDGDSDLIRRLCCGRRSREDQEKCQKTNYHG